ncbi:hypothetical protein [Variovorax sp. OV084]|jgi:hypothetical protein|uniref:hypothetical protein n=1 Tax=Variovorax sp. OV084 TaxID=1882777 RepID=UPI0008AD6797|nr:hypothetical protein [Variovorax sp. OV084]SET78059.1 hypothetical protein SAMN05443580_106272 [Variovorax sp. OV084]
MKTPAGELIHVAYLGAFVVSGVLCRDDLYRDAEGAYWAEPTRTNPDGSWESALHRLDATDQCAAVGEALLALLVVLDRDGLDPKFMTIIHHAPGLAASVEAVEAMSPRVH